MKKDSATSVIKAAKFHEAISEGSASFRRGDYSRSIYGGGSTLAAANHIGYESIGVEIDREFFDLAEKAIPALSALPSKENN